jgi:hypothetical protein
MGRSKNSIENFMGIIEQSHEKTASRKTIGGDLLAKLAAELEVGNPVEAAAAAAAPAAPAADAAASATAAAAPAVEGARVPAESLVEMANPAVVAQTAAVADPQVAIAGGNLAEAAAGEVPAPVKPNQGVRISANDGVATDANNISRTPEAVVAAASDVGGEMPSAAEAEKIGSLIAQSFHKELQKIASDQEYSEAVSYLSGHGLLDNYNFNDGMSKVASLEPETNGLEKIANNANLTRQDIIDAATELSFIEKNAAAAEEAGREQAREFVKQASEEQGAQDELKKLASDKDVMAAVALLKQKNLI